MREFLIKEVEGGRYHPLISVGLYDDWSHSITGRWFNLSSLCATNAPICFGWKSFAGHGEQNIHTNLIATMSRTVSYVSMSHHVSTWSCVGETSLMWLQTSAKKQKNQKKCNREWTVNDRESTVNDHFWAWTTIFGRERPFTKKPQKTPKKQHKPIVGLFLGHSQLIHRISRFIIS